ncbi:hypothetical protein DFA_11401 [Cavenderia fasciculata]|uniref:Uncharacterized protein n=1 Tax=Cavenderia fasciculata TaxID=261658 RepID=F4QCQ8_CACFS|nr:uncharacterized protein DFA_11401 [Cavenderia fasciculata]EGG13640.1 hypothetical protein DFA_11401 [Cavenderia fasciculata]|eukprot:XP_004350344.1 hypothetical protein DFA_11401 [Cavenderia fasciculata]
MDDTLSETDIQQFVELLYDVSSQDVTFEEAPLENAIGWVCYVKNHIDTLYQAEKKKNANKNRSLKNLYDSIKNKMDKEAANRKQPLIPFQLDFMMNLYDSFVSLLLDRIQSNDWNLQLLINLSSRNEDLLNSLFKILKQLKCKYNDVNELKYWNNLLKEKEKINGVKGVADAKKWNILDDPIQVERKTCAMLVLDSVVEKKKELKGGGSAFDSYIKHLLIDMLTNKDNPDQYQHNLFLWVFYCNATEYGTAPYPIDPTTALSILKSIQNRDRVTFNARGCLDIQLECCRLTQPFADYHVNSLATVFQHYLFKGSQCSYGDSIQARSFKIHTTRV